MSRRKIEVLIITDENGDTDWQVDPAHSDKVDIVHIDYRDLDGAFPDKLEDLARSVQHMSKGIPWRSGVLRHLQERHADAKDDINGGSTYGTDVGAADPIDESPSTRPE